MFHVLSWHHVFTFWWKCFIHYYLLNLQIPQKTYFYIGLSVHYFSTWKYDTKYLCYNIKDIRQKPLIYIWNMSFLNVERDFSGITPVRIGGTNGLQGIESRLVAYPLYYWSDSSYLLPLLLSRENPLALFGL